jgi:hypothetical protein
MLIVSLNTIAGFFWGGHVEKGYQHWVGMIAGVLTWYIIYVVFDRHLIKKGLIEFSKKLNISAILKIFTQLTVYPEFFSGYVAYFTLDVLRKFVFTSMEDGFFFSYLLTFLTGFYLSLMCAVIFGLVSLFFYLRKRNKLKAK